MTTDQGATRVAFIVACRHDVPKLAALARLQLPEMPALHDEEGWRMYHRFGPGFHPRDNYLVVARFAGTDDILGFVWADAAPLHDHQVADGSGRGGGRRVPLRTSYRQSAGFWRRQGFDVAEEGEGLQANRQVRLVDGSRHTFAMSGEAGNHLFVRSLAALNEADAARLERAGTPFA